MRTPVLFVHRILEYCILHIIAYLIQILHIAYCIATVSSNVVSIGILGVERWDLARIRVIALLRL